MKDFIVPTTLSVATILFIAACATPFIDFGIGYYTFFEACYTISGVKVCFSKNFVTCEALNSLRQAVMAFLIMTTIFVGSAAVLSVCRMNMAMLNQQPYKLGVIGLTGVAAVFGLICWALSFAAFSSEFCGSTLSKIDTVKLSASPICSLIGWLVICAGAGLEFVFNNPMGQQPKPAIGQQVQQQQHHQIGMSGGQQRNNFY